LKKIKAILIFFVLIFLSIQTASVNANVVNKKTNEKINLEYSIIQSNGKIESKEITADRKEVKIFETMISMIIDRIINSGNNNILDILDNLQSDFKDNNLLSMVTDFLGLNPLQQRKIIISEGYGRKISLRTMPEIKINKQFNFWFYKGFNDPLKSSRTLIVDPIPDINLRFTKLIEGRQIGFMTDFMGFYLKIPGNIVQDKDSHTFFIGIANNIITLDLPDIMNRR